MISKLRTKRRNIGKRGTYILEASLIIPPFVIVMILLISVIGLIGSGEKALFVMGEELKLANIKAAFSREPISMAVAIQTRTRKDSDRSYGILITDYGYLYEEEGLKDLISVEVCLSHSGINPLGKYSFVRINQRVVSRAFTGLDRRGEAGEHALSGYENSEIVYVFPNRGEKYHNRSCSFLNPASEKVFLTTEIKRRFRVCENCNSQNASLGDVVFCFFNEGKVYHLGNCSAVDKYYVEMEKKDAEARGYVACLTCGG